MNIQNTNLKHNDTQALLNKLIFFKKKIVVEFRIDIR